MNSIASQMLSVIKYTLKSAWKPASTLLIIATPFLMYIVGAAAYEERGYFAIGGEIFLPIMLLMLAWAFRMAAQNSRKHGVPVPERRFTEEYADGEITVRQDEIEEMILYMFDLENYFERAGRLRARVLDKD